ncbi:MAG: 50S ribosomal protein L4 [Candidatus Aenigmatarchaeota archaeon]
MVKVYDLFGKHTTDIELPGVFLSAYRPEIIRRAFQAYQSWKRQAYGADPLAGKRTSAHYHGRRRQRWTMMGREMSRMARIHGKVGYLAWTARFVPQAVKGRKAHPPKAEKIWAQKINKNEYLAALKSAIASSIMAPTRHKINESPIIFVNEFESIKKAKDVKSTLMKLIPNEIKRCSVKNVRSGKGKMRGRKNKRKTGPLIITSEGSALLKAARNLPGFNVVSANDIDIGLLAPGGVGGRCIISTKAALKEIEKRFGE